MSGVVTLLEDLVMAALVSDKVFRPSKSKVVWGLMALTGLLAAVGTLLLIYGFERFLEGRYTPDIAALLTAGAVFAVAFLAALGTVFCRRNRSLHPSSVPDVAGVYIRDTVKNLCDELEGPIRENPKTAVLLAALAGYMTTPHHR